MKRPIALFLAAVLLLAVAGCTTRPQTVETEPPVQVTQTPTPTPTLTLPPATPPPTPTPTEEPEPPYHNPLNGVGMMEPYTARPFAVMVNNLKEAQPQCGISHADVIYEVLAEGGVTRMMAIFSDIQSVEHLGSIRSIRPYYIDISLGYGAVTIHAGGSPDAYTRIKSDKIENLDGVNGKYPTTNAFYRDQARRYSGYATEHTLFTEGKDLYKHAENQGYGLTVGEDYDSGLHFAKDTVPEDGVSAKQIDIAFNGKGAGKFTSLHYDADIGLYTAKQYNGDYIDGNTKETVKFRNVIAITAFTKVLDSTGRLRVDLIGEGTGYYACGGKYEEITWKRDSVSDCFHYYRADGSELLVGIGSTYIAVLSQGSAATIQSVIEFT